MTRYPIYIISKGRWNSRLTVRACNEGDVDYRIVVEPTEYDKYAAVIDERKILTLPFHDLGQGSIPARNWVWDHAVAEGAKRHWILDDNIRGFYRLHKNKRIRIKGDASFRAIEDFVDRYTNVALSGMHYRFFAPSKQQRLPFIVNRRIYSCILIENDIPFRWRGRYNEDTDLSLRVLKDGWCTVLFYAFLANKVETMTMKGGNTDELYQDDGRYQMAKSLKLQHPDVTTIKRKWGRWQHQVDYRPFKDNRLIKRTDIEIPNEPNEYGMKLVHNTATGKAPVLIE